MTFTLIAVAAFAGLLLFGLFYAANQYKRVRSDEVLIKFGKIKGGGTAECFHGGGTFIIPLIQDYKKLSLRPISIEIPLSKALSKKNIRVNVPSTFTIAISTSKDVLINAAERLLSLTPQELVEQARDIILGQLRLVIANMTIEEINTDRDTFLSSINANVTQELNKIGLDLINVNVQDITDESGYIEAIGKRAAAEAIETAKVDVSEQVKTGAIGVATAEKAKQVQVAEQQAETAIGQKSAEKTQRVETASFQAEAIKGENTSQAEIAKHNANLQEEQAAAFKRGEVAKANAEQEVAIARKEAEVARLQMAELAKQEVKRQVVEVNAAAEAEAKRLVARGEADAILFKYEAEAKGTQKVLEAKAEGYNKLVKAAGGKELAPTLLMIEQFPEVVKAQVAAVKNLKIDKITVWDSGKNETAGFIQQFGKILPPFHELASQAGIKLPSYLGTVDSLDTSPNGSGGTSTPTKTQEKDNF